MEAILFMLVMVLMLIMSLYMSARLTKRAISRVIDIFYQHDALGRNRAKTIDELGLTPPNLLQRMTQLRDYKPYALKILMDRDIIQATRDGRLYLLERNLENHEFLRNEWVLHNGEK
jgi:hypothetical protein